MVWLADLQDIQIGGIALSGCLTGFMIRLVVYSVYDKVDVYSVIDNVGCVLIVK